MELYISNACLPSHVEPVRRCKPFSYSLRSVQNSLYQINEIPRPIPIIHLLNTPATNAQQFRQLVYRIPLRVLQIHHLQISTTVLVY